MSYEELDRVSMIERVIEQRQALTGMLPRFGLKIGGFGPARLQVGDEVAPMASCRVLRKEGNDPLEEALRLDLMKPVAGIRP